MTSTSTPVLTWEQQPGYLRATLARPEARNAINAEVVAAIHELCAVLESSPQVLVFSGSDGVFAAGADIRELRERRPDDALKGINSRAFDRLARLAMPTIALVDGPAVGGGAELSYAFDIRVATPRAFFSNPEVGLGIVAAAGAGWRLPQLVGPSVARQVLLAGRRLSAEDAAALGLVMTVVSVDEAEEKVAALATRIGASSARALTLTKLMLSAPPSAHPTVDDMAQGLLFGSDDAVQRMTAFLEGKK